MGNWKRLEKKVPEEKTTTVWCPDKLQICLCARYAGTWNLFISLTFVFLPRHLSLTFCVFLPCIVLFMLHSHVLNWWLLLSGLFTAFDSQYWGKLYNAAYVNCVAKSQCVSLFTSIIFTNAYVLHAYVRTWNSCLLGSISGLLTGFISQYYIGADGQQ